MLEARLITDAYGELDAVEQELGLNVHGLSGSVADRLNLFMDRDGQTPHIRLADADTAASPDGLNGRKRMRSGISSITSDDLDNRGIGTITWSPPLAKMRAGFTYTVWLTLQVTDEDIAAPEAAAQVAWIVGTQTDTTFEFVVQNGLGDNINAAGPPTSGSFLIHWLLIEKDFSGEGQTDLDDNTGGAMDDGGNNPGRGGKFGLEDGDLHTAPADFLLLEDGASFLLFEGPSSTVPAVASFLLLESSGSLLRELDLPADETFKLGLG